MENKKEDNEAAAVLAFLAILLGLLGYWWWQQGDAGRLAWLSAVGGAEGYGPAPRDMLSQLEWLAMNRLRGFEGMAALLLLSGLAGLVEGNARREALALSGFGLRPLKTGRVFGLLWTGCLVLWFVAPVPLPYAGVSTVLSVLLGLSAYKLARGVRRTH